MPPAAKAKPRPRKPAPPAPPPVGPDLRAAALTLSQALAPLMASVLAATDVFKDATERLPGDTHDGRLAGQLLKAVRDQWDRLSWWGEEAGRVAKGEAGK